MPKHLETSPPSGFILQQLVFLADHFPDAAGALTLACLQLNAPTLNTVQDQIASLIAQLESLRVVYPALARHLDPTIKAIRREQKRTPAIDRRYVLRKIRQGCASVPEIAAETNLPNSDVQKIVAGLIKENLIEVRKKAPYGSAVGTNQGRPQVGIIVPAGTPNAAAYQGTRPNSSATAMMEQFGAE
ncbi:MAG: hypothetical protein MSG64_15740 [Pyrinomonadaceae bacterium MAG19_C2-C3]|nr:hypothetical protein [Pyrinomonadaceae bacterium MAG19_C2-C3]